MADAKLCGAVAPVAIYILVVCFAGAVLAGAAFAWAALRGEFSDAAQAAFLVFDEDDGRAAGGAAPAAADHPSTGRT